MALYVKNSPKPFTNIELSALRTKSRKRQETVTISPELLKRLLAWYAFAEKFSRVLAQVRWTVDQIEYTRRKDE